MASRAAFRSKGLADQSGQEIFLGDGGKSESAVRNTDHERLADPRLTPPPDDKPIKLLVRASMKNATTHSTGEQTVYHHRPGPEAGAGGRRQDHAGD